MARIRNEGGVYTPPHIVMYMLDVLPYKTDICNKHIMDAGCGDGAFLCEIVKRYCDTFKGTKNSLKASLETFIHGVEINTAEWEKCINNLNKIVASFGITDIKWDIHNADALNSLSEYYGKMDFVGFNPPYVKVHNLQQNLSNFEFCGEGMTDLYLAFFEIGLKLLSKTGKMVYITPNSFFNSVAGKKFRRYIYKTKCLSHIIDMSNQRVFNAAIHTVITKFDKNSHKCVQYKAYEDKTFQNITYNELFIDNTMIISNNQLFRDIIMEFEPSPSFISVKNGFATLADNIFIADNFSFSEFVIDIYKASTRTWKKCLFPYRNTIPVTFSEFPDEIQKYFLEHKKILTRNTREKGDRWWLFGHSQGVKDTKQKRYAINTLVRDKKDIYIQSVEPGKGIYSGLYILAPFLSRELIEKCLCTDDFINYVKVLKKHKMGGYFTFSSKDLEKYLIYHFKQQKWDVWGDEV